MSRKGKTALYAVGAFGFMLLLIWGMAAQQGIDPTHPRTRNIWLLAVVVALYASIRGAVFIERLQYRKSRTVQEDELPPSRHSRDIRDRMAARKARVEAARKKSEEEGDA